MVDGLQGTLLAEELENIRDCIEPRIDRVLDLIIDGSGGVSLNNSPVMRVPFPQLWEGDFRIGSRSYPMLVNIEKIDGQKLYGQINWPKENNVIVNFEGEFVSNFGGFSEKSKWKYVKTSAQGEKDITWIKFTDLSYIQSSTNNNNFVPGGTYYGYMTKSGMLKGVRFRKNIHTPTGDFTLVLQP